MVNPAIARNAGVAHDELEATAPRIDFVRVAVSSSVVSDLFTG
jgi:hypothetical protein